MDKQIIIFGETFTINYENERTKQRIEKIEELFNEAIKNVTASDPNQRRDLIVLFAAFEIIDRLIEQSEYHFDEMNELSTKIKTVLTQS